MGNKIKLDIFLPTSTHQTAGELLRIIMVILKNTQQYVAEDQGVINE